VAQEPRLSPVSPTERLQDFSADVFLWHGLMISLTTKHWLQGCSCQWPRFKLTAARLGGYSYLRHVKVSRT
jgi:hypothetical protein